MLAPIGTAPGQWRRIWPFVLPTALLALLAGFSGQLNLLHASVLAIEGVVVYQLWKDREAASGDEAARAPIASIAESAPRSDRSRSFAIVEIALGLILAGIGAWLTIRGAVQSAT